MTVDKIAKLYEEDRSTLISKITFPLQLRLRDKMLYFHSLCSSLRYYKYTADGEDSFVEIRLLARASQSSHNLDCAIIPVSRVMRTWPSQRRSPVIDRGQTGSRARKLRLDRELVWRSFQHVVLVNRKKHPSKCQKCERTNSYEQCNDDLTMREKECDTIENVASNLRGERTELQVSLKNKHSVEIHNRHIMTIKSYHVYLYIR